MTKKERKLKLELLILFDSCGYIGVTKQNTLTRNSIMDTFKRVKANGFAVLIMCYCGSWVNVRYIGLDGKNITRETFWIYEKDLRDF